MIQGKLNILTSNDIRLDTVSRFKSKNSVQVANTSEIQLEFKSGDLPKAAKPFKTCFNY